MQVCDIVAQASHHTTLSILQFLWFQNIFEPHIKTSKFNIPCAVQNEFPEHAYTTQQ